MKQATESEARLIEVEQLREQISLMENEVAMFKHTEQEVRESEQRFQAMFDSSPFLSTLSNVDDGRFLEVNQSFLQTLGYDRDQVIGKTSIELGLWVDQDKRQEIVNLALEKGTARDIEIAVRTKSANIRHGLFTATIIEIRHQRYLLTEMNDVTESKQDKETIRIQRDLAIALNGTKGLSETLNTILDNILEAEEFDCGAVYLLEEAVEELNIKCHFGLPASFIDKVSHYTSDTPQWQVVMKGVPLYAHASEFPAAIARDLRSDGIKAMAVVPMKYRGKAIGNLNLASHKYDTVSEAGKNMALSIANMVGSAIKRVQTEEALKESEDRFRSLVETTSDLIWEVDRDGIFTYISPNLREILGYMPEELIGKRLFSLMPTDEAKRIADLFFKDYVEFKKPIVRLENTNLHKDGHSVVLETSGVPVLDENGGLLGYRGIDRDISERKRAEEAHLTMERQIQHGQKLESLGVLAGGIAHDFNNLLMAILGNASLARLDMPAGAAGERQISQIIVASERAAELCQQLLAYSGRGPFVVRPVDLSELVTGTACLLEVSVGKAVTLRHECQRDLAPVEADVTQLRQVVMNLVVNAAEAIGNRPGIVTLTTGAVDCDADYMAATFCDEELALGKYSFVEVSDNGCGMDEATQKQMFDPFFSTKKTGRGLGMAAVLGIVRGHKGALKVYSEPGRGTTVKVLLPATDQPVATKTDAPTNASTGRRGLILVADDEIMIREVAAETLRRTGYEVVTAKDGEEALSRFREHADRVSLVLLDLMMPKKDGAEVFVELRRLNSKLPVILSSGYNTQDATNRFAGKGLAGFIQKPYAVERLEQLVAEILSQQDSIPAGCRAAPGSKTSAVP